MTRERKNIFKKGIRNGLPIGVGYFAVSFALGIAAVNAGISPFAAMIMSLTNLTSAGEYAGITVIAAASGYVEMAVIQLVTNARYLLMSFSLSQKFDNKLPLFHRLFISFGITDEIFALSSTEPGKIDPVYIYGILLTAIPGWTIGTLTGAIMGNILPKILVNALSVGLFGMFIAIIIPPARKSIKLSGVIVFSMCASYIFSLKSVLPFITSGTKNIILIVIISLLASLLFPVKEENGNE